MDQDGPLCVKCGYIGHISKECSDDVLPAWEQLYLREIVFGSPPQLNFASAGYGEFDGNVRPYGTSSGSSRFTLQTSITSSPMMSGAIVSPSNSIIYGVAGLSVSDLMEANVNAVEANLGEGSDPNKRLHTDDEPDEPLRQQPFQFQATDNRRRAKGQKRVGKKTEPQPLVGMFNDLLGKYDTPTSIRQVMQNNKVDLSWMDFVAWSPAACREIKRICTRVSKKKDSKASKAKKGQETQYGQNGQPNSFAQFNPQYGQQYPQQFLQTFPQQFPQGNPQTQIPQFFQPGPAGQQTLPPTGMNQKPRFAPQPQQPQQPSQPQQPTQY